MYSANKSSYYGLMSELLGLFSVSILFAKVRNSMDRFYLYKSIKEGK